jgi:eukaryotic-like serine/threonine-protein kinase
MNLTVGTKLGPYEILAPIGAGGMGEVYRAHDSRVGRDVALKVSSEQFGERFEREIRAVASLNHSNICTLYDVGPNYLVMELVEGPTLADRIKQGAIPLEESLEIARQIADALEAAHEKGIVHRDLKPANIKIKPDGTVKVLDFGLAKVGGTPAISSDNSPTLSVAQTAAGVILGTAAYMSPEQAKGKTVDKRSDIWSFGAVLYEMLTGHRIFEGETISDTLASVIRAEPEWDRIPAKTRHLLRSCLQKDPRHRLADISDARLLLENVPEPAPARRPWLAWSVSALCLLVALTLAWVYFRQTAPSPPVITFTVPPPNDGFFVGSNGAPRMSLSPDGRYLAFMASVGGRPNQMWIRRMDSLELRALNGTERAESPVWSPDSRFIGFFVDGKLKKVEAAGGPVRTLCSAPAMTGSGSWNQQGEILFGGGTEGLKRVSAEGGAPTPVTAIDPSRSETGHRWPQFLPDGRHFLYFSFTAKTEERAVFVGSLDSKETTRLIYSESMAAYAPPGYLLYVREGTLMAQAFDAAKLQLTGQARPVAESVILAPNGRAAFSISAAGILAYRVGASELWRDIVWFDRAGKEIGKAGQGAGIGVNLSPDGRRVATARGDTDNGDLWIIDLARNIPNRFTFDIGFESFPVWSPDGSRIAFVSGNASGAAKLVARPASGLGQDEVLLDTKDSVLLTDWSADGNFLVYQQPAFTPRSIWYLPLHGDRKPARLKPSPFYLGQARLSPDSHWIAYASGESGNVDVYIENFPESRGKRQISIGGGYHPRWRHGGKEIFYLNQDGALMAVPLNGGSNLEPGTPLKLFQTNLTVSESIGYDVTADGQRFLMAAPPKNSAASPITVVVNWIEQLKK